MGSIKVSMIRIAREDLERIECLTSRPILSISITVHKNLKSFFFLHPELKPLFSNKVFGQL
jgi:hypothetical protein